MAHNHETIGGKTNQTTTSAAKYHSTSELSSPQHQHQQQTTTSCSSQTPIVYGELSILGYNGYIPNTERNGRRNRSKFLLCKRSAPNGIKKSRHYIVKQPQATKAIQDKDLHSISYTFSRSQTIIVEYRQDENTDMFQIGRSSEDPIDFIVMDTISTTNLVDSSYHSSSNNNNNNHPPSSGRHNHHNINNAYNENSSSNQHQMMISSGVGGSGSGDMSAGISRFHRHLVKVGDDLLPYGPPPPAHDHRHRVNYHRHQAVLLNYPQPNISNLPPMMANHFRNQESSLYHSNQSYNHNHGHSSGASQQQLQPLSRSNNDHQYNNFAGSNNNSHQQQQHHHESHDSRHNNNNNNNNSNSNNNNIVCKRSHATQSTISRFACRILVDRTPPYTARIYAAGFDSSKNIFLGEKATKWEQDSSIDGLTTNGVLLMHPKQGTFYESSDEFKLKETSHTKSARTHTKVQDLDYNNSSDISNNGLDSNKTKQICSNNELIRNNQLADDCLNLGLNNSNNNNSSNIDSSEHSKGNSSSASAIEEEKDKSTSASTDKSNDSNNNSNNIDDNKTKTLNSLVDKKKKIGGVWREVSVDGGIYAIRESRSAAQKGTRIEDENNILQDGTLIDLCGATLLWRSVDGFKASPTKESLEEKIDLINASRPQCPVGLNTLVIPRKPIIPSNHLHRSGGHSSSKDHHGHHSSKSHDKNSHQPYVYLKCGHVQGYHDWGATDKSNLRTCPICLSVGAVAKLSMGLEPSFYVDSGPLTHVFSPCGHMASDKTVRYWCSIKIPHGTHFFHSICPFCATPLATNEPSSARLIFQDDLD